MASFDSFDDCLNANIDRIATKQKLGRLLDVYHFQINGDLDLVKIHVESVLREYNQPIKYNLNFGFILKTLEVESESFRYFHPANVNPYFNIPVVVTTRQSPDQQIPDLTNDGILEHVYKTNLTSNWTVMTIIVVSIKIYKMV